jgi:hypothetical protein
MSARPAGCRRLSTPDVCSWLALWVLATLSGCGGGGPAEPATPAPVPIVTSPAANTLAVTLDRGPDGTALNAPFVSVTVCVPGTATCQTVDHVLVDTGSNGLRLVASFAQALSLPAVTSGALPVGECAQFASGFVWGSVRRADVKLAGEMASNIPIQLVGERTAPYTAVPPACSNTGANFGANLGVNGILGIGLFNQDCPGCAVSAATGVYFGCVASGACSAISMPLASQVANPVAAFAADNNGVALTLPDVPLGGVSTLSGSLTFGIGTQSNNQLGTATVYTTNSQGNFTTVYKGITYDASFLDSGSNGIFFRDSIPNCSGFYCPSTPLSLSAVNTSAAGVSASVNFTIENIQGISRSVSAANVGGDVGLAHTFDWGLPFFFGRTVFVAFSGAQTPKGPGPYWAY